MKTARQPIAFLFESLNASENGRDAMAVLTFDPALISWRFLLTNKFVSRERGYAHNGFSKHLLSKPVETQGRKVKGPNPQSGMAADCLSSKK